MFMVMNVFHKLKAGIDAGSCTTRIVSTCFVIFCNVGLGYCSYSNYR